MMHDSRIYFVTTGSIFERTTHARRKRRDHAEAVARRLSAKYPDETYVIWERREYDGAIGPVSSSQAVATYRAGEQEAG